MLHRWFQIVNDSAKVVEMVPSPDNDWLSSFIIRRVSSLILCKDSDALGWVRVFQILFMIKK